MSEKEAPEQKILLATIECINEDGMQGVTVRRIAERAGVNVAAINYYFRSKNRLVDAALEQTMHNAFDEWIDIVQDRSRSIRLRLLDILQEMVWGVDAHPGLTRAHLHGPFVEGQQETLATNWLKDFIKLLATETAVALPRVAQEVIQTASVELIAAAMFVPMVPGMFASNLPYDLSDEHERYAFVTHLLDTFFRTLGDKHEVEIEHV